VLCDKRILVRLNGKVLSMVLRPALLYDPNCWPIKDPSSDLNGCKNEDALIDV